MVVPQMERDGRMADLDRERSMSKDFKVSKLELCASDQQKPPWAHSILLLRILCVYVKLLAITMNVTFPHG